MLYSSTRLSSPVNGGGGSSITLYTNGTINGSQTIFNLVEGSGIELSDDGMGSVTISSDVNATEPRAEVPTGRVDGSNTTFVLSEVPAAAMGTIVLLDGVTQYEGIDYTVTGDTIEFDEPPADGSSIFAYYNVLSGAPSGSGVILGGSASGFTPAMIQYISVDGLQTGDELFDRLSSDKSTFIARPQPNGDDFSGLLMSDTVNLGNYGEFPGTFIMTQNPDTLTTGFVGTGDFTSAGFDEHTAIIGFTNGATGDTAFSAYDAPVGAKIRHYVLSVDNGHRTAYQQDAESVRIAGLFNETAYAFSDPRRIHEFYGQDYDVHPLVFTGSGLDDVTIDTTSYDGGAGTGTFTWTVECVSNNSQMVNTGSDLSNFNVGDAVVGDQSGRTGTVLAKAGGYILLDLDAGDFTGDTTITDTATAAQLTVDGVATSCDGFTFTNGTETVPASYYTSIELDGVSPSVAAPTLHTVGDIWSREIIVSSAVGLSIDFRNKTHTIGNQDSRTYVQVNDDSFSVTVAADNILAKSVITDPSSPGDVTINVPYGTVYMAAGENELVVTNEHVSENSNIQLTLGRMDSSMTSVSANRSTGSFTIKGNALCDSDTRIDFQIINNI